MTVPFLFSPDLNEEIFCKTLHFSLNSIKCRSQIIFVSYKEY